MKRLVATSVVDIMLHKFSASDRRKESRPAVDFISIDLHKNSSQVCILTEEGELVERRIKTDRESFDKLLGERPPRIRHLTSTAASQRAGRGSALPDQGRWRPVQCLSGEPDDLVVSIPQRGLEHHPV